MLLHKPELSDRDFARISALVYKIAGIALPAHKKELVKARLGKRLRVLGLDSWRAYIAYLSSVNGESELANMLNAHLDQSHEFFARACAFSVSGNRGAATVVQKARW